MSGKGFFLFVTVLILGACGTDKHHNCQFDCTKGLEKVASGVWKAEIGNPDKVNLLSELDFNPKIDAINNIEEAELPVDKAAITAEVFDGKTYIRFPLDKEEKVYALVSTSSPFNNGAGSPGFMWITTEVRTTVAPMRRCRFSCQARVTGC